MDKDTFRLVSLSRKQDPEFKKMAKEMTLEMGKEWTTLTLEVFNGALIEEYSKTSVLKKR